MRLLQSQSNALFLISVQNQATSAANTTNAAKSVFLTPANTANSALEVQFFGGATQYNSSVNTKISAKAILLVAAKTAIAAHQMKGFFE